MRDRREWNESEGAAHMLGSIRKCWLLLTPRQRWQWAGLIPLAVLSAGMEALGAVAVFGLIKVITDPSSLSTWPLLTRSVRLVSSGDPKSIVLAATVAVAVFNILKNLLIAAVAAVQTRVITDSVAAFSARMLEGYLALPFAVHLRRNSSELIRNITDSVDQAFRIVLLAIVGTVSEAFIVAGIVTVLLITAPTVAFVAVVVLFALLLLALRLTRSALTRWGKEEHELKRLTLETLRQTLGGLKEVKVRGRERFFYDQFAQHQAALMRLRYVSGTLGVATRMLIETVFVCGTLLVIVLITLRGVGTNLVALLGLYAYAGFRIIPSVNRILMHLNSIRYGTPPIEGLYADLLLFRDTPIDPPAADGAGLRFAERLELEHVSYTYDGAHTPALQDVSVTIHRGQSIGVVGPTGAGKSTLIDLLLGLLRPSTGRITIDGVDVLTCLKPWQRKIGYVPQAVYLIDDTLRRNVAFGMLDAEIDMRRLEAAVRMAQLQDVVAALPLGLETVVGERGVRLSGGERQRVAIARALYHEPELLVFDEATSALDNQTERELTRAIEALHGQKTLIIIAHRLSTVQRCDRLVFLRGGRVAGLGSYDELVARNDHFRAMASSVDLGPGSA